MLTHYNVDKLWIMTFEIYNDILKSFKDLSVLWRKVIPLKKDTCLEFGVSPHVWTHLLACIYVIKIKTIVQLMKFCFPICCHFWEADLYSGRELPLSFHGIISFLGS